MSAIAPTRKPMSTGERTPRNERDGCQRMHPKTMPVRLRKQTSVGTLFAPPPSGRTKTHELEERMGAQRIPVDPDTGIPDLIHRLGDDSKRLMTDEVRLAKLETKDSLTRAG